MLRSGRLIISPYFQRNLVWREAHKHDFIDTILSGLPFPQIFLARGPIDVNTMTAYTCVVDGQQRLSAIREFAADAFPVNGRYFSQLENEEKTAFIKYEVPVIDFDLDAGDSRLKDVFKRLNRTFYSLSTIERIATEYSASEFLLLARVLCGDISSPETAQEEMQAALDVFDANELPDAKDDVDANSFLRDPGISEEKWDFLMTRVGGDFARVMAEHDVFSPYEYQRKVPLMFVLNVMATILGGYYGRNSKVKEFLETYSESFEEADEVLEKMNRVARIIEEFNLPQRSIWWNKANFFSMVCELAFLDNRLANLDTADTREKLLAFEADPPREFQIAAREAVNNRPERVLRGDAFRDLLVFPTAGT
ncbi:hypothetical protein ATB98_14125 [Sinorhizobium saheli]|nr:hypothetical protein ATB98_14125 [Sinorhizobium saheli]